MSESSTASVVSSVEVPRFRTAYEQLKEEIHAVPADEVVRVNVDVPTAVTIAIGAQPGMAATRARIAEELPKFDLQRFDKLLPLTLALGHTQTLCNAASVPSEPVPELADECARLTKLLRSDAQAAYTRELIDGSRLKDLKGTVG